MLDGVQSLVDSTMPDWSRERPDKEQFLALQVGGWAWGQSPHPVKTQTITETPAWGLLRHVAQRGVKEKKEGIWT